MTNQGLFCFSTSFIISTSFKLKSEPTIVTRYCMHPVYVVSGAGMALRVGGPSDYATLRKIIAKTWPSYTPFNLIQGVG